MVRAEFVAQWVRARAIETGRMVISKKRIENATCGLSSLAFRVNSWVQGTVRARRCHCLCLATSTTFNCESSRVVHGASKRRRAPQTTRDTPEKGVAEALAPGPLYKR